MKIILLFLLTVRQKSFLQNFKQEKSLLMDHRFLSIDGDSNYCVLVDWSHVKKFLALRKKNT